MILEMAVVAVIVAVSESEFHAFLSEKFAPNGKRSDRPDLKRVGS